MSYVARITICITLLGVGLVGVSCERAGTPRDSSVHKPAPGDSVPDSSAVALQAGWPDEGGPFLVIPDDSLRTVMIVPGVDDSTTDANAGLADTATIDLFSTAGKVGTAKLIPSHPEQDAGQCQAWPNARVQGVSSSRRMARWSVGLLAGHVEPLAMDSLAGVSKSDSTRLVSEIARVASTTPNDSSLIFRGLPFRVQTAFLLQVSDTETVMIATVIRNINQEASARAEHLLLVSSRAGADRGSPYVLRYFERNSGPEETVESAEILGALLVGTERRPTIVLGRSDDAGMAFSLIQRDDHGNWTLRWSSAFSDC